MLCPGRKYHKTARSRHEKWKSRWHTAIVTLFTESSPCPKWQNKDVSTTLDMTSVKWYVTPSIFPKTDEVSLFLIHLGNYLPKILPRCVAWGVIGVRATQNNTFHVAPNYWGLIAQTDSHQNVSKTDWRCQQLCVLPVFGYRQAVNPTFFILTVRRGILAAP